MLSLDNFFLTAKIIVYGNVLFLSDRSIGEKMKKFIITAIILSALLVLGCDSPPEDSTYKVLYYGNGNTYGFAPTDPIEYTSGMEATVLGKNTLEKTGYTFQNWNTRSDGTGDSYMSGDKITINYTNVFLYAVWAE